MFSSLVDRILDWLIENDDSPDGRASYLNGLPPIDWRADLALIQPHVESHTVYVLARSGEWLSLSSADDSIDAVALVVAYENEHTKPWETEVPAKHMAEKLSRQLGKEQMLQLSRNPTGYAGYYVHVRT